MSTSLVEESDLIPLNDAIADHDARIAALEQGLPAADLSAILARLDALETAPSIKAIKSKLYASVKSNTTLLQETDLNVPIAANETLDLEYLLWTYGDETADFKLRIDGPSGATGRVSVVGMARSATDAAAAAMTVSGQASLGNEVAAGVDLSTVTVLQVIATVENGANAGNVTFSWAQAAASAGQVHLTDKSRVLAIKRVA